MSARDQMIASVVTVLAVFGGAWAVYLLLRKCKLGWLMDDGDGQGGIPPLPRRTRPIDLSGLVIPLFRDPARDCDFCAPRYNGAADCGCALPCADPGCGALLWAAVASTEEFER